MNKREIVASIKATTMENLLLKVYHINIFVEKDHNAMEYDRQKDHWIWM